MKTKLISILVILTVIVSVTSCGNLLEDLENAKKICKINFNSNGGTGSMSPVSITEETITVLPENKLTRTGYSFSGWALTASATTVSYPNKASFTMPSNDVTLYAVWEAGTGTKYVVEHYQQNLACTDYVKVTSDTQNLSGVTGANAGYNSKQYVGFTYDETRTTINDTKQTTGTINADGSTVIKLYYTRNTYKIIFNSNGGEGSMTEENFTYDEPKTLTENTFTKTYYLFTKWNTKADGTGSSYDNGASFTIGTSDVILYAQWKPGIECTSSNFKTTIDSLSDGGEYTIIITGDITLYTIFNSIKANSSKKINLDLSQVTNLTKLDSTEVFNCTNLINLVLPSTIEQIKSNPFISCSGLQNIVIDSANAYFKSINGVLFSLDGTKIISYPRGKTDTEYTIPNSVTSIDEYVFYNCSSLKSVDIPNSVTSIGNSVFYGCSSLTSVDIPNGVTSIGGYTFRYCSSLTSVDIPNSVTSISGNAFQGCSCLTSVVIPNSVTLINMYVFEGCSSLKSIIFNDTSTWYCTTSYQDCAQKQNGTNISVNNSSTNATNFTTTYLNYYFYKL